MEQSSQWIVSRPDNLARKHRRVSPPPPHTPSTGRVGHYPVVVYPKRFHYVAWYFNMQEFEQS